jgi:mannose-6-phosphate isomerase-like protein (cupin superfamily)
MIKDAVKGIARSVRPWGEFYGWDSGEAWYLKTLMVSPGKRLSLQYHNHRAERWVLVEGEASAIVQSKGKLIEIPLKIGETFIVDKKTPHRLSSKKGGKLVEVAIGRFDENDIVRLEDDHGRA